MLTENLLNLILTFRSDFDKKLYQENGAKKSPSVRGFLNLGELNLFEDL
jgi:hypothetical protein